jgi:hypothetical protein
MKTLPKLMLMIVALAGTSGAALAADKCFETKAPTYAMLCDGSSSNSADFASGCRIDDTPTEVEVPCPIGRWVSIYSQPFTPAPNAPTKIGDEGSIGGNASWLPYVPVMLDRHPTHAEVCANAGMRPSSHEGAICASGRQRPTSGDGWSSINYVYGTEGGSRGGGSRFTIDWAKAARKDGGYCHTGSYKEFEKYMAVAFFCEQ